MDSELEAEFALPLEFLENSRIFEIFFQGPRKFNFDINSWKTP